MSSSHVRTITEQTFDSEVLAADVPILVDFTATWCGPCRALVPILHKLAAESGGRFGVATVDAGELPELTSRFAIKAFPTVIAFSRGKEIARHVGLTTKTRLLEMIAIESREAEKSLQMTRI